MARSKMLHVSDTSIERCVNRSANKPVQPAHKRFLSGSPPASLSLIGWSRGNPRNRTQLRDFKLPFYLEELALL